MNNQRTEILAFQQTDLASRSKAQELRLELLKKILEVDTIVLDFSNVDSISDSYADELFGILVTKIGVEGFFDKFTVVGANRFLRHSIAANILTRQPQITGSELHRSSYMAAGSSVTSFNGISASR